MKKFLGILLGATCWFNIISCYAAEKFDILPDLPEPIVNSAAQASSVSTVDASSAITSSSIGHEPNLISIVFSLFFVILLIYATGIIYTKLNKMGISAFKKQIGSSDSHISVVSTTPLGTNKTLHIVELDGKRMLIGASVNSIHLIKDLGNYSSKETNEIGISKIEIPNIRIPKIEIPKIEIPNIGFTKTFQNAVQSSENTYASDNNADENNIENIKDSINTSSKKSQDEIIDKLFQTTATEENNAQSNQIPKKEHTVNPEEFVLYKKYL